MGLRETFQKAARTAIQAFGDVGVSSNYQSYSTATYNASAGTYTPTYSTVAGVTIIFADFTIEEIDNVEIKANDKKALIAALDISTVTPAAEDLIIQGGKTWEVVSAKVDPADALWQIQVRTP